MYSTMTHHHNHHHNHRVKSPTAAAAFTTTMLKLTRHQFIKRTLLTLFLLLSLYLFLTTFLFSPTLDPTTAAAAATTPTATSDKTKIRIFMYELPRKFTYGVIHSYTLARRDQTKLYDETNLKYPGNQHSAEWYLFSDLARRDGVTAESSSSAVVRVWDPEEAELFYVPFFSSLSLVVNTPNRGELGAAGVGYSDERMQEELVEWLEGQEYWRRNKGWDHVIICQDPNALFRVMDRIRNGILLLSDFGRLRADQASLVKDVILPYSHRINPFKGDVGVENRKSLLFFMGNRYRKEGGKIRDVLFQILENENGVIIKHGAQSRESRRAATQGMHTSKFCLHPAGDTPSACRLFDAIVSLCVPVIISDQIELPFEDAIDYKKIAVFVDSASAVKPGFLINLLRSVSEQKILEFQREIKKVKHYFEYEDPNGTVKEIWRQVSLKVPLVKLMINRDKRFVGRESSQPDCSCLCSNWTGPITTL